MASGIPGKPPPQPISIIVVPGLNVMYFAIASECRILNILARYDVDFAVPVEIEVVECRELLLLSLCDVWEIFDYAFHYII